MVLLAGYFQVDKLQQVLEDLRSSGAISPVEELEILDELAIEKNSIKPMSLLLNSLKF